jgi:hypothetical protein
MNVLFRKRMPRRGNGIVPLAVEPRKRKAGQDAAQQGARHLLADLCCIALRASGWLALTGLSTLGLFAVFFMALGGFTADGFFAHLANLSVRFVDADPHRQTVFVRQLTLVTLIIFLTVSAARYRSLAAVFPDAEDRRKD